MGEPVIVLGKGLVDAVVEVLVVGEDDVATDIVELVKLRLAVCWGGRRLRLAGRELTKPSGVTSVLARPPARSAESTISHEGPFCKRFWSVLVFFVRCGEWRGEAMLDVRSGSNAWRHRDQ